MQASVFLASFEESWGTARRKRLRQAEGWLLVKALSLAGGGKSGFLRKNIVVEQQQTKGAFRVACLGDSHTRGTHGYDWLGQLAGEFGKEAVRFQNHGVNGELAYGARRRLAEALAGEPDLLTVFIGSNDVNAVESPSLTRRYIEKGQLPQVPDKGFFVSNLRGLLAEARSMSQARIALITLPVLGEKEGSPANLRVADYNREISDLAVETGAELLDLNAALWAELRAFGRSASQRRGHYDGRWLMHRSLLRHYVLRQSWDRIGEANGYRVLSDGIHLNERAGRILAELVRTSIEKARDGEKRIAGG